MYNIIIYLKYAGRNFKIVSYSNNQRKGGKNSSY